MPGMTTFEGADAGPDPMPFVAITLKVYATPLVRPVTVHPSVAVNGQLPPLGDEETE
jgi:hypothetical protein